MRLLFIFSFLVFHSSLIAQHVFPNYADNADWSVYECFWLDCTTRHYNFEYDTTFCGKVYSKVNFDQNNLVGYFRSDSLKTYFRKTPDCSDKEYLMYDYSLSVGDTAFVGYNLVLNNEIDTNIFILTAIDTITINGVQRQRFNMKYDLGNSFFRPMYWIKGIGSTIHPFYPFKCLMDGCEESFQLLCYDSLSTQLYQSPTTDDCISLNLGLSELENKISLNPNPFSELLSIYIENASIFQLNIYSSVGTKIKTFLTENKKSIELKTDEIPAGYYLIEMMTDKGVLVKKLLKI